MNNPIISVVILSYNHEKYIEKAINGVLSQKTTFLYELLLFDDGSTDNTQNIINYYSSKYPEKIKSFCFNETKGPVFRAKQIYENCKYKYITWLDADDYWTYEYKLQKQIDFLEQNLDFMGCFHDANIESKINIKTENNLQIKRQTLQKYKYYSQFNLYQDIFTPYLLIQRNIIPTASLVFRNIGFDNFFEKYNLNIYSFSWAIQLEIISNGNFKYFNNCWSTYYDHNEGLSKKITSELFTLNNISILKFYKKTNFYKKYKNTIYKTICKEYECIIINKDNNKVIFKYMINYLWFCFLALFWDTLYYMHKYIKQILQCKKNKQKEF